jgi:HlyD family secretion protein
MKKPFRMTKVRWVLAVIIWFLLVSCPFSVLNSKRQRLPAIRTDKVVRTDVKSYVSGPATINPRVNVEISSNIMGKITKIYVREGQPVKKGDLLLELERTQYLAGRDDAAAAYRIAVRDVELARSKWETAKSVFDRKQELYAQNLISPEQYDLARTQYEAERTAYEVAQDNVTRARAGLTQAKDSLSKTLYTSPLDGVVTAVNVEEGEFTVVGTMNNPGTVMLTVADLAAIEATTDIDETDVVNVRLGQPAKVTVDAFPERAFYGEVVEIGSSAKTTAAAAITDEKTSADFEVKVLLRGGDAALRPGMNATTDIETGKVTGVPTIPIQALVTRTRAQVEEWKNAKAGKAKGKTPATTLGAGAADYVKGVFVLVTEKPLVKRARFIAVETGVVGDQLIEIKKGLTGKEVIIAGPYKTLRTLNDGDLVKLEEAPRPGHEAQEKP